MTSRQDRTRGGHEHEEILALVPDVSAVEADALLALVTAAAGPATTGRLPGEDAAVAAFRAAQPRPVARGTARRARIVAALTGVITVKTAAVAFAVTSVGGAALAASTGALPAPLTLKSSAEKSTAAARTDAPDRSGPAADAAADAAAVRDAAKAAAVADRVAQRSGGDPATSYTGLCRAFTAGAWTHERAAGRPAFSRLVRIAPGGNITAFCAALEAEAPAGPGPNGTADRGPAKPAGASGAKAKGPGAKDAGAQDRAAPGKPTKGAAPAGAAEPPAKGRTAADPAGAEKSGTEKKDQAGPGRRGERAPGPPGGGHRAQRSE